jgi:hypothetical protein
MGENTILMETCFDETCDVEAIYLLGTFGVCLQGTTRLLDALPDSLHAGSIVHQGLPFYSGKVTYRMDVPQTCLNRQQLRLHAPHAGVACMNIHVDGHCCGSIAWKPDEMELPVIREALEIEAVLTRWNTFGPLHLVPPLAQAYGPMHFVTEGDAYADDCQLLPAGMMGVPALLIMQSEEHA